MESDILLEGIIVELRNNTNILMDTIYQNFYNDYLDWISDYTLEGGLILFKKFDENMMNLNKYLQNSNYGDISFSHNVLPPKFISIAPHSHIMPEPIFIQCIQQTDAKHFCHTIFFNLKKAISNLSHEHRLELESYLSKPYEIPWVQFPHDHIGCAYHSCDKELIKVANNSLYHNNELIGFGMMPHVWFRDGGGFATK
eukprot:UN26961